MFARPIMRNKNSVVFKLYVEREVTENVCVFHGKLVKYKILYTYNLQCKCLFGVSFFELNPNLFYKYNHCKSIFNNVFMIKNKKPDNNEIKW